MEKTLEHFSSDAGKYAKCIIQTPCSCAAMYKYMEVRKNAGYGTIDHMFNPDTFKIQNKNYKHKLNVIWNSVLVAKAGEKVKK
jgi:hypothetical protein